MLEDGFKTMQKANPTFKPDLYQNVPFKCKTGSHETLFAKNILIPCHSKIKASFDLQHDNAHTP